jgi:putative transposase
MERKIKLEIEEFYHVYNRGVEKRLIFKHPSDYKRFLVLLYITNGTKSLHMNNFRSLPSIEDLFQKDHGKPLVAIGAYCLMPNHFHLLLTPLVEGGVSKFMLKLQTGYSMYFNKKNDRVGSLFQGVFKSQHINKNRYLMHIYSYIHLNPAKLQNIEWKTQKKSFLKTLRKFIISYPYSSLQEYLSENYKIIDPKPFPVNKKDICNYNSIVNDYSKEFSFVEAPPKTPEEPMEPLNNEPQEIFPPVSVETPSL